MLPRKEKYMNITSIVARIASDADLRRRFLKNFQGLLNDYYVSVNGEITREPAMHPVTPKFFLDGFNLAGSIVKKNL